MKHFVLIFLGLVVAQLICLVMGGVSTAFLSIGLVAVELAMLRSVQEQQERIEKKLDRLLKEQDTEQKRE